MSNISTLSWENKLLFEWVSDCCLMPIELFFNFIMGEQVTFWVSEWLLFNANWAIFQLYHGRTSYFLSEWVSDCCLMPSEQYFNCIMGEQVTFWVSEWVSDCCLMPSEQYFNFIMGEQVTFWVSEWLLFNANWAIFQLYHGRTSYFLSEWVIVV